jgi:hypothetical protein
MWYSLEKLKNIIWKDKANQIFSQINIIKEVKKNKYNVEKVNGFDSKKEKNRFDELRLLEKTWTIQNLQIQVPFVLQESFELNWQKIRDIRYLADFVYLKNWQKIVEDTKWMRTQVFILKKKMFLKNYWKEYVFIES